ncbi:YrbL family protein [Desulfobacter curvatus]|uniref:YrbL family protein n=1 Tax=Desulfobacter curvatus TaxID=2290 RepID=UPI00037FFAB8|nr:YrbL family protein [Desulfobacter curvatus]
MINIQPSDLIGKGVHRKCYIHPENANQCIKIVYRGGQAETIREQKYYRYLAKRGIPWEMLAQFHGNVETNFGIGAVFDFVRDDDGNASKTLDAYFKSTDETTVSYANIFQCLCELKHYLLENNIITMGLKPRNILYKRLSQTTGRCVIVDNIGNSDFIPICTYNKFLGNKKILRKWDRFEKALSKEYHDNTKLKNFILQLRQS